MRGKYWVAIFLVGICGALATGMGCSQKDAAPPMSPASVAPAAPVAVRDEGQAKTFAEAGADKSQAQASAPEVQRLIIRSADLFLKVDGVRPAADAVQAEAKALGGFVVQASVSGEGNRLAASVTVRVPAEKFDEAVKKFKGLAEKVLSERVAGEDVTDQYVDLESQLRNLEASRGRILEFLQKATHAGEALEVNRALIEVQGEIERIQGRMKYLKESASLSSISVTLTQESTVPMVEEGGFKPVRIAKMALRALLAFGLFFASLLIVLLVWSPVWLVLWWLLRTWKRRRAARNMARSVQAERHGEPRSGD